VDFVSSTGFRRSFSFSCLLTLDLDNFCFIQVDFVADGGLLLIIHIGFRKFRWISWISIFIPTVTLPVESALFFIPSTSLCSLSFWFTSSCAYHLITSHHLRSHHLSLPLHFTPDLKFFSFTNPFLHSYTYSFRTDFTDLDLY